jgi:hypothetical protein
MNPVETPIVASDINVSGTLQNLLNQGFNERDGLCEEIDNSLDWGATQIKITLDSKQNVYIHADNGCGMGKKKLEAAFMLNNRKDASEKKLGRFGIGGLQAKACLTNLKGKTTTVSKSSEDENPFQIDVNWPECVKENKYRIIASEASSKNEEIYRTHVTTPFKSNSGTIHIYKCDPEVFKIIHDGLSNKQINESYIYYLEVKYQRHLKNGISIEVLIDNTLINLMPIDPLQLETLPEERKEIIPLELFCNKNNRNEIYVRCPEGCWIVYKSPRKSELKEKLPIDESALEKIDSCTYECAYSDNWYNTQSELFKRYNDIVKNCDASIPKLDQKIKTFMGGKLYERNGVVVTQFPAKKATSGDKARYPFQEQSRFRFKYTSKVDELMKTQVNKSALKEDLFHPSLKNAFELLEKRFIDKMYSKPNEAAKQDPLPTPEPPKKVPEETTPVTLPKTPTPEPPKKPEATSPATLPKTPTPEPPKKPEATTPTTLPKTPTPEPPKKPEATNPATLSKTPTPEPPKKVPEATKPEPQKPDKTAAIHNLIELKKILSETPNFNNEIKIQLVEALTETVEPKHATVFKNQWMSVAKNTNNPNILIDALIETYSAYKQSTTVPGCSTIQKLINHINTTK